MNNSEILDEENPKNSGIRFRYPALICCLSLVLCLIFQVMPWREVSNKSIPVTILLLLLPIFTYGYIGLAQIANWKTISKSILYGFSLFIFGIGILVELFMLMSICMGMMTLR
jgi:hypothetical protein